MIWHIWHEGAGLTVHVNSISQGQYMENYPSEIGTRSSKWMVSIQAGPGAFADVANVELEEPQAPQSHGWFCCAAPWALRNARGAGWGDVWFLSIGSCFFFWWVVHLLYSDLSICTRCCLLLWVMFTGYIYIVYCCHISLLWDAVLEIETLRNWTIYSMTI